MFASTPLPFWRPLGAVAKLGLTLALFPINAQAFLPTSQPSFPDVQSVGVSVQQEAPEDVVRVLTDVLLQIFDRVHVSPPNDRRVSEDHVLRAAGRVRGCTADAYAVSAGSAGGSLQGCIRPSDASVHIAMHVSTSALMQRPGMVCGLPPLGQIDAVQVQRALTSRFAAQGWRLR